MCGADARYYLRVKNDKRGRPTLFCIACRTRVFFGDQLSYCGFLVASQRVLDANAQGIDTGALRQRYHDVLRARGLVLA